MAVDDRVHPRQRDAVRAGVEEAVGVDVDVEARAAIHPRDRIAQRIDEGPFAGRLPVVPHRDEEPERRVDGVVCRLRRAVGEAVRDHAAAHRAGPMLQDAARVGEAAGGEAEPGQRDHRVAPPVGEPVVAGDDGVTHEELVGRALELPAERFTACALRFDHRQRVALAALRRQHDRQHVAGLQRHDVEARRPEILECVEAALFFAVVDEVQPPVGGGFEARSGHVDIHVIDRTAAMLQRVVVAPGQKRREAQLERRRRRQDLVEHDRRVLAARRHHGFAQADAADLVLPNREHVPRERDEVLHLRHRIILNRRLKLNAFAAG